MQITCDWFIITKADNMTDNRPVSIDTKYRIEWTQSKHCSTRHVKSWSQICEVILKATTIVNELRINETASISHNNVLDTLTRQKNTSIMHCVWSVLIHTLHSWQQFYQIDSKMLQHGKLYRLMIIVLVVAITPSSITSAQICLRVSSRTYKARSWCQRAGKQTNLIIRLGRDQSMITVYSEMWCVTSPY